MTVTNNLRYFLYHFNVRITTISKATGLSRTTLTEMSKNNMKGVQYETIDKLSKYFNIDPGELFRQNIEGTKLLERVKD